MSDQEARARLHRLAELLREERQCAINLDLEGMAAATREKATLIKECNELPSLEHQNLQDRMLAQTIQAENRRNAYLFWSALKWIRASMEFFGRELSPRAYDADGGVVIGNCQGRLLSGKV